MGKIFITKSYRYAMTGLGIAEVAFGCTVFCLALGSGDITTNQTTYSNILYLVLTLVTSLVLILCGGVAIDTAKRGTSCYLMLTLVFSTVATLFSCALLGLQVYVTVEYQASGVSTPYTFAALTLGCVVLGTSFFLCFTNICLTCTAGGACGPPNNVSPSADQNAGNAKDVNGEIPKNDLPLHEPRPSTAKINEYWNEAYVTTQPDKSQSTNGKKTEPVFAEDV
ncbi:uncharacterized protein LOC120346393 [Styela clava]